MGGGRLQTPTGLQPTPNAQCCSSAHCSCAVHKRPPPPPVPPSPAVPPPPAVPPTPAEPPVPLSPTGSLHPGRGIAPSANTQMNPHKQRITNLGVLSGCMRCASTLSHEFGMLVPTMAASHAFRCRARAMSALLGRPLFVVLPEVMKADFGSREVAWSLRATGSGQRI